MVNVAAAVSDCLQNVMNESIVVDDWRNDDLAKVKRPVKRRCIHRTRKITVVNDEVLPLLSIYKGQCTIRKCKHDCLLIFCLFCVFHFH